MPRYGHSGWIGRYGIEFDLIEQLKRRIILGVLLGVVVVSVVIVISDASALANAFRSFDWRLLPIIVVLILLNYVLRFVKWQYYLGRVGVQGLSTRDSALIFVSGFTMVMTPGKLGELLKAYLVRTRAGAPLANTIPVVLIERFTDGIATLLLIGVGIVAFPFGWPLFVGGVVATTLLLFFLQKESLVQRVTRRLERTRLRHRVQSLEHLYQSARSLLELRPLLIAVGLGVVSWFGECAAFFVILTGLGIEPTWHLLLAATFVFGASAWFGALSLLPGGLGAAEASAAALLVLTIDNPALTGSVAGAATLLMRFATLWFGVLLGVVALAIVSRWTPAGDEPLGNDAIGQPTA